MSWNPNTPAQNKIDWDRRVAMIEKCGKNGGPHDLIPVLWRENDEKDKEGNRTGASINAVAEFMCRICYTRIGIDTLLKNYPEAKL